jgi:proteasome lid subunit RPN8/RPN11
MSILKNFVNPWGLDTGVLDTGVLDTDVLGLGAKKDVAVTAYMPEDDLSFANANEATTLTQISAEVAIGRVNYIVKSFDKYLDNLWVYTQRDNKEWSATFTHDKKEREFKYTNERIGITKSSSMMNLNTRKEETVIGVVHTHPSSRQPSPQDLSSFRKVATKVGNFSLIEGGAVRYAMVVLDIEKAKLFYREHETSEAVATRLETKETRAAARTYGNKYNQFQLGLSDLLNEIGMVLLITEDDNQLKFETLKG